MTKKTSLIQLQASWHPESGRVILACFSSNLGSGPPSTCVTWRVFPSQLDSDSWRAHCRLAPPQGQDEPSRVPCPEGKQDEVKRVTSAEAQTMGKARDQDCPLSLSSSLSLRDGVSLGHGSRACPTSGTALFASPDLGEQQLNEAQ